MGIFGVIDQAILAVVEVVPITFPRMSDTVCIN